MFKKQLIKIIILVASFLSKNKKIKTSGNKILVNLGCGLKCLPNWINVDGSLTALFGSRRFIFINNFLYKLAGSSAYYKFEEFNSIITKCNLHFCNLQQGIPFDNNSIDVIYVSHFLEHLNKKDGEKFIRGCFQVLKIGGLIRILVPNLDIAFEMYKSGRAKEMLDSFFYTSDQYDFHMHKYNYNFEILSELLKKVGFKEIIRQEYQKGECPDIDFLDIYPDQSLFVEAKK